MEEIDAIISVGRVDACSDNPSFESPKVRKIFTTPGNRYCYNVHVRMRFSGKREAVRNHGLTPAFITNDYWEEINPCQRSFKRIGKMFQAEGIRNYEFEDLLEGYNAYADYKEVKLEPLPKEVKENIRRTIDQML